MRNRVVSQFQFTIWLSCKAFVLSLLHTIKKKLPTDLNQRAKSIIDIITGEDEEIVNEAGLSCCICYGS